MSAAFEPADGGSVDCAELAAIYAEHAPAVLRMAHGVLGDHSAAQDIAHEVFLTAWRRLHNGPPPFALRAWLLAVARNAAIDHRRRQARVQPVEHRVLAELADRRRIAAPPAVGSWISEPEVAGVLRLLPHRQQEILVLRYALGASLSDAARVLGCTEAATWKAHERALTVLRRALGSSLLAAERGRPIRPLRMRRLHIPRRLLSTDFTPLRREPGRG
jgi:RNA polymerase sigma-70 factor (ECF subfamily)